jgi:hypothetical protein
MASKGGEGVMKKYRGGQSTAEYAILIALVIGAAVAMQTYVKRSLQGGIKFAVDKVKKTTNQYEPYYLESSYDTTTKAYTDIEATKEGGRVERIFGEGGGKVVERRGSQTIKNTENAH